QPAAGGRSWPRTRRRTRPPAPAHPPRPDLHPLRCGGVRAPRTHHPGAQPSSRGSPAAGGQRGRPGRAEVLASTSRRVGGAGVGRATGRALSPGGVDTHGCPNPRLSRPARVGRVTTAPRSPIPDTEVSPVTPQRVAELL